MEGRVIRLNKDVYCRTFMDMSGLVFFSARTCNTFFVHQPLVRTLDFATANDEMCINEFIEHFQDAPITIVEELEARGLLVRV